MLDPRAQRLKPPNQFPSQRFLGSLLPVSTVTPLWPLHKRPAVPGPASGENALRRSMQVQAMRRRFVRRSGWIKCVAETELEPGSSHRPETASNLDSLHRETHDFVDGRPCSKSERRRQSSAKAHAGLQWAQHHRSEEHTSELQS